VVLVGEALEPGFHALAHWLNARLAAPVDWIAPPDTLPDHPPGDLAGLCGDIAAGRVSCLAILGTNPVQTAPARLSFPEPDGEPVRGTGSASPEANKLGRLRLSRKGTGHGALRRERPDRRET
jgi:hypothetical protein